MVKFDRQALINSINAGIASQSLDASRPVAVQLLSGGRLFSASTILVK